MRERDIIRAAAWPLGFMAALFMVLAISACGGGSTKTVTTTTTVTHQQQPGPQPQPSPAVVTPNTRCVTGDSFMGCAQNPGQQLLHPQIFATPPGRKFIDVSDWQPFVDWQAAKHSGAFGVVIKAGEGTHGDPTFASHVIGARNAGLKIQAYWFVRPVGCVAERNAINAVVPHGMRIDYDEETPGLSGYASCMRASNQAHTGILPGDYTSPGTFSDGSARGLPLWQATYGPTVSWLWTPHVAWQYTDAGINSLDTSADYGLFAANVPPGPVVIGGAQHYERHPNIHWSSTHSRERATVMTWDKAKCRNPARRSVCQTSHAHLLLLLHRDQQVYKRQTHKQRAANRTGGRIQGLVHRAYGRGVVNSWQ